MRINFMAPSYDTTGLVTLLRCDDSDITATERRVSRTATLDGGVTMPDMGYTDGDRTFSIRAKAAGRAEVEAIHHLHRSYPQVVAITDEGMFLGAIQAKRLSRGDLYITYLVNEKLTED